MNISKRWGHYVLALGLGVSLGISAMEAPKEIPKLPLGQLVIEGNRVNQLKHSILGNLVLSRPSARKLWSRPDVSLDGCVSKKCLFEGRPIPVYSINVKTEMHNGKTLFLLEIRVTYSLQKLQFDPRQLDKQRAKLKDVGHILLMNKEELTEIYFTQEEIQGGTCAFGWGFYTNGKNPPDLNIDFHGPLNRTQFEQTLNATIKAFDQNSLLNRTANRVYAEQLPELLPIEDKVSSIIPKEQKHLHMINGVPSIEIERKKFVKDLANFFEEYATQLLVHYIFADDVELHTVKYTLQKL